MAPLHPYCYDLDAGVTSAGILSGSAAGWSFAGASLDLSSELSLSGAPCAEENFLKDMRYPFHCSSNDLLLINKWWLHRQITMGDLVYNSNLFFDVKNDMM